MTWTTPSTKSTGARIGYTDWVDEVVHNINELYHRRADSMACSLPGPSTGSVNRNTVRTREMRTVEMGGIEDWTSLDTIEADSSVPAYGGPGEAFTVPKAMSGLWRFSVVGGATISGPCTLAVMWSFNSTQDESDYYSAFETTTSPSAWTYQWCAGSMATYNTGLQVEPSGIVLDRFSSGDTLRFYTVARLPASTFNVTHSAGLGQRARLWAQFLGTTV